jgi:hypothetical protein
MMAALVFADQVMSTAGGLEFGHEMPCRWLDAESSQKR